ncbi:MAG TPA: AsmA family protein [Bradyrhizobium sp.]|nr:AsmA family protein [Bradyrhizobium sp.]
MQTTLLGLAIAFIIALIAALIGPYFIDWNQFRPQFEAEATRVIGSPVRVGGAFDARLLPTPSLRLGTVTVGGANDLGKVRADKLDVEFSLGSLMRGEWRANELTINGMALDLGLDSKGQIDWPASSGKFNLGTLAVDRLNLTGRIALHDAASRATLELNNIAFSGDVRALAGSIRGDGNLTLSGARYPFRVSSGQSADGAGTRVHLNIDPGARALSAEVDGVLSFEARGPRFDGSMVLAVPAGLKALGNVPITPWRISAKVKADPSAAKFDSVEASYGAEESALKVAGTADMRFGAAPLLHAALSARQLDLDRFAGKDGTAADPIPLLPGLRALMAGIPQAPLPAQLEFSFEQIILGGRPLQNLAADLRADAKSWSIDRLDLQAPGATHVALSRANAADNLAAGISGALSVESADPDMLAAWLQGRREIVYRNQKPLRLRGDVGVTADRVSIEAMKAEIDGGAVEGRLALSNLPGKGGTRFEAELKAERLDLDAATAFVHSLAGPQADWPDEAQLSLESGSATSAGQELRSLFAKVGYSPKEIVIEGLKIGQPGNAMLEGGGNFDRVNLLGKLALNSTTASLGQLAGLIAPFAPSFASRLNALGPDTGPVRAKLTLDLTRNKAATGPVVFGELDLDAPQLTGNVVVTVKPAFEALRGIDLDVLSRSEVSIGSKLSVEHAGSLLMLLGLDRAVAAGEGPAQFEGSATGAWRAPLQLKAKLSGTGLEADAQGSAEPWNSEPKVSANLKVRSANLAPLFGLKPSDVSAQNVSLSSQVSLKGGRLTFEDMDSAISGTRLRGRIALTLDDERNVEGEIGLDALELAPAFALAVGAAGHEAAEPLGGGWWKGWRGRVGFQALRGALPGGAELRPVSGALKNDGQSLTFESIKGGIGGGEASADVDVKPGANGIAVNARVELTGVDGTALRYRGLTMPAGRASLQMTLASQGRSASALTGALSGNGIVTLQSASVAGLDPRAFDAAIRASDSGQATDDVKLRRIVEPVLSAGALSVASAQIPFTIGDGRLRVGASTLDAEGARAIVSGGYDIPADQADIRVTIASTAAGTATRLPEIQLFAVGSPDRLDRTVDVAALSSWLAVRAIDRETRRLDSIERGEPPPLAATLPSSGASDAVPSEQPSSALPGRDLRRVPAKPKVGGVPRPPAPSPPSSAPVVTQQLAPLPPPIEVRPAPGGVRPPKPRQPLVLTPPVASPPPSAF